MLFDINLAGEFDGFVMYHQPVAGLRPIKPFSLRLPLATGSQMLVEPAHINCELCILDMCYLVSLEESGVCCGTFVCAMAIKYGFCLSRSIIYDGFSVSVKDDALRWQVGVVSYTDWGCLVVKISGFSSSVICGLNINNTEVAKWTFFVMFCKMETCRPQWPRSLRQRSSAARLLRLWVRIPLEAWMFVVSVVCCQVEVSCDGLITCPEESYRLWRMCVCDQETSKTRRLKPSTGLWKYNHSGL